VIADQPAAARAGHGVPNDLREYIAVLEDAGELRRVKTEVDWRFEAGAMSRLVTERRGPAPLFERVKDYPGQQIAAVLLGPSKPLHGRIALALGLPKTTPTLELIEAIRRRLKAPQPPVLVDAGRAPCREVIVPAAEVDLERFAFPWIKEIDGGRYLGTSDIIVTEDPETGWVNWGTYRCMVTGRDRFSILLKSTLQHGGGMLAKYQSDGKPMPIALVIGADPASHLIAGSPVDHGANDAELVGGLRGTGLELVKCETNDLLVPANAEYVIEAEVLPGELVDEGPFGEYTGHSAQRGKTPVARVTCITHRRNPIYALANMGKPWDDFATFAYVMMPAIAKNRLEANGVQIKAAYHYVPGAIVVSVKPQPGIHRRIISILLSSHRLAQCGVVFVDEDVDVTDIEDVWWAICTRMNPENVEVVRNLPANLLWPWLTPPERERREGGLWVLDASFPFDWTPEYRKQHTQVSDFKNGWSEQTKQNVLRRWTEYGYDDIV
jgi:UbiD family decarboxylase